MIYTAGAEFSDKNRQVPNKSLYAIEYGCLVAM
jgi:hypothetical protein